MFKKRDPNDQTTKIVNNLILVLFLLLSISISISLYKEKKYHEFAGWLIITLLLICFLTVYNIKPKPKRKTDHDKVQLHYTKPSINEGLVLLYSTKNHILFQKIIAILESNGIDYQIFDWHAASLMNFLSEVEMKIMVNIDDYEYSIKTVNSKLAVEKR